jgi:hypothetical protein
MDGDFLLWVWRGAVLCSLWLILWELKQRTN